VVTLTADTEGRLSTEVLADVQQRLSPLGDPRIHEGDVLDWDALLERLRAARNDQGSEPAARIWEVLSRPDGRFARLSASADAALEEALASDGEQAERPKAVLHWVNKALSRPDLFTWESYDPAGLSAKAAELLEQGIASLAPGEVRFLNRERLVAAWPTVLAPNQRLVMPANYEIRYAGEKEEQDKAQAFLSKAFLIAVLLVVMVLVIQFNSLTVPLIIMTTVALSLIGALVGLLVCDLPFGIIMSGIGVISLAGVVVNNAIVLLAYTRQLQAEGMELVKAAAEAGATRLRPVLLTATTTIIGLVPMAVGVSLDIHSFTIATRSESTQWWRNMAVVVIFGLAFATVLTLVVVPSLYVMLSRLSARVSGLFASSDSMETPGDAVPGVN
jgi:hypothetical protein